VVDWLIVRLVDRLIRWDVTPNTVSVAEQDHVYSAVPSRAEDPDPMKPNIFDKLDHEPSFFDGSSSTYYILNHLIFLL